MSIRPIIALDWPDAERASVNPAERPIFEWVDPRSLHIDEDYQRNLSDRSHKLIKKIIAEWQWSAFKPPIVVMVDDVLHVVDGQHTAIAAATHGGIPEIPVMIIDAPALADRAGAFVKHNRDRIQASQVQMHHALVAAGDEDALTIQQVCDRAGAIILRNPPFNQRWNPSETIALSTIKSILAKRHAQGARRVVQVCVKAELAPISALFLRAVDEVLFGKGFKGTVEDDAVAAAIKSYVDRDDNEGKQIAAKMNAPQWMGLAVAIHRKTPKRRVAA